MRTTLSTTKIMSETFRTSAPVLGGRDIRGIAFKFQILKDKNLNSTLRTMRRTLADSEKLLPCSHGVQRYPQRSTKNIGKSHGILVVCGCQLRYGIVLYAIAFVRIH
jgi:hypothetical protein